MKSIIALLFGLASLSFGDKVLEFDSDSSDTSSTSTSYNGIIVAVYQDEEASPVVALGSDIDNYDDVYCLNFIGLFEASSYDTSVSENGEFTEIANTNIDLADSNCTTSQQSDTQFTISCNDVNDATLTLTFTFTQDSEGDYGVEYTISLNGYTLSQSDAKLVLVQSVKECSDLYDDLDSNDEDDEDDEVSTTEAPDDEPSTTGQDDMDTTELRRRMQETETTEDDMDDMDMESTESADTETTDEDDTSDDDNSDDSTDLESLEEEDGVSSDDSDEFDAGFARFVVDGQALDVCEEGGETTSTEIGSALVFQEDDDELHIVFDAFECELVLDPFYGLDESKYEAVYAVTPSPIDEDKAGFVTIGMALIIGFVVVVFN